jgi:predicted PurR-regulated permease PerM
LSLGHQQFYARAFALSTTALLGLLFFRLISPLLTPVLWACLLAFMLQPLNVRLLGRKQKPLWAAALLTAITFLVVLGPLTLFFFAFLRQTSELLNKFQAEAAARNLPALQMILEFGPIASLIERAGAFTSLSKDQILQSAAEAAQGALQQIASLGGTVVVGAFTVVSQFLLTMFILFFLLRDGRQMMRRGIRLVPMQPSRKEELLHTLGGVTRAVVMGSLVTALVQGTLVGLGFGIAGLPSPLVFGAIGALASLIPIVGTSLIWIPGVVTLFAQGQTGWAIFLLIWSIVLVAGSDNVVRPMVISGNSNAPTLLIFMGLLGGVSLFGFAGVFMGPLILTLISALLKFADEPEGLGGVPKVVSSFSATGVVVPQTQPPGVATVDDRTP